MKKITLLTHLRWKIGGAISEYLNKRNNTRCEDCRFNGKYHDYVGCMGGMERYASCSGWTNKGFEKYNQTKEKRKDNKPCFGCEYSQMGIPCGHCTHEKNFYMMLPDTYWFYNRPKECPLNENKINING